LLPCDTSTSEEFHKGRQLHFLENSLLSAWGIKNYKVLLAVAEARKKKVKHKLVT